MDAARIDLVGSWRLLAIRSYLGGELENEHYNGMGPVGFIHYLDDGRAAVLIAHGRRPSPEVRPAPA